MAGLRLLILLVVAAFWTPASAEAPACVAEAAGTVACIAERLCRCAFQRGGSMTGQPAGYRWDCGTLRPSCHRPPTLQQRSGGALGDIDVLLPLDLRPARDQRWPRPRPRPHPPP